MQDLKEFARLPIERIFLVADGVEQEFQAASGSKTSAKTKDSKLVLVSEGVEAVADVDGQHLEVSKRSHR